MPRISARGQPLHPHDSAKPGAPQRASQQPQSSDRNRALAFHPAHAVVATVDGRALHVVHLNSRNAKMQIVQMRIFQPENAFVVGSRPNCID